MTTSSVKNGQTGDGRGPLAAAVANVLRNRLAVIGLVLVATLVTLVMLAPVVCDDDPREMRPWLRAQPPGFTHPDCGAEDRFVVGSPPRCSPAAAAARRLSYALVREAAESYRIVLWRGRVRSITRDEGALALAHLDLGGDGVRAVEVLADGGERNLPPGVVVRRGEAPPPGLFAAGQRVLLLRLARRQKQALKLDIELDGDVVTAIREDGREIGAVRLRGDRVLAVAADGRELLRGHLLGTDELGRDLFARVLYGGRISLLVGVVATAVSLCIGVLYGAVAGYAGGRVDRIMMAGVDILYAIPFMFLVIILLVNFGRNIVMLFIALGAVQWLTMARIVRGQVLSLKEKEYIAAARLAGARPWKIIFRHLIPHTLGPVLVYTTLTVPVVILEESFLAFIGLSVQYRGESLDSWGALVHQGMQSLGVDGGRSWLLLWPSLAMALTLLGLNCLGDGLRDALDPRLHREGNGGD